ncbi:uncharacterized protein LOC117343169 [Pecten maximus]|uniref:uncharacterized protein LOC117343169 n=1 Tax=Pecten maximus TaxID=6579 RepID=UPI00145912E8|nr:uncharacterized protein LOC117343169 [Pecten maximus]
MSGWHSLSGYLYFKEGGGISLLRSKKKLWCVLEESQCQLLYFKTEEDVHNKSPLGSLNIQGAAISLDLDNHNQFIIISDNKEYQFTAENHESMMIWLLGLQAKRDRGENQRGKSTEGRYEEEADQNCTRRISDITRPGGLEGATGNDPSNQRKLHWHRGRNGKLWESVDTSMGLCKSKAHIDPTRSRSLPPVFEDQKALEFGVSVGKMLEFGVSVGKVLKFGFSVEKVLEFGVIVGKELEFGVSAGKVLEFRVIVGKEVEFWVSVGKEVEFGVSVGKEVEFGVSVGKEVEFGVSAGKELEFGVGAGKELEFGVSAGKELEFGVGARKEVEFGVSARKELEFGFSAGKELEFGVSARKELEFGVSAGKVLEFLYEKPSAVHCDNYMATEIPLPVPKRKQVKMSRSLDTQGIQFKKSYDNLIKLSCGPDGIRSYTEDHHRYFTSHGHLDSSSGGDSDEVFGDFSGSRKSSEDHQVHVLQSDVCLDSALGMELSPSDPTDNKEPGSCSSLSVSSDSAIDKGETTSSELASRLMELEKELISTKCELAKVINQQSGYQELLAQRDDAIRFLEGRLDTSGADSNMLTLKNSKSSASPGTVKAEEMEERLRVLQHQNRFLNLEVKKLAKLRQTERESFFQQEERIRALEAEIEKWKVDYVSIIRSSIRYPGGDTMDEAELILFGGDRHQKRIIKLLEDARKSNPSLPTYESLNSGDIHVDVYGFKHVFEDQGLLLHYLCQELTHHYILQAGPYEDHHRKWTHFMRQHGKSITNHYKELKTLCRGGIPDRFRKQVWRQLIFYRVKDTMDQKGMYYFRNLCNALPDSPMASCYRKQISLDLMRTMPSNTKFSMAGSKGIMDLQDVLLAFCVHNPAIGYCQGMNFIVGMALLFMDAHDAFWMLVAFTEQFFQKHYFDHNLIGAQSDQHVFKDILAEKLPHLNRHLDSIDIEISTVTLNWFLAIFFDAVPFQTLLRIWDCFLLEGPKVLFRFTLAILKMNEKEILQKRDTISIMRYLKTCAKHTFDADSLIMAAFKDIKGFPRRQDMATKQACYLKTLKDKNKQKELQRLAYTEREHLYFKMENETGNYMGIGSAVAVDDGKVWFCYGDQNVGKVSKITCEEGLMYDINLEFDSRVMCLHPVSNNIVLLGTLSWMLYAYNTKTRDSLWKLQLHDAILSLCCYDDKENMVTRHFAGLADGTLAVMEQSNLEKTIPESDIMYIPIGQAPLACLLLLGDQLWVASGNTVSIIHARTLDTMDSFTVSINPYDHILSLITGQFGVWIILRGSSILELWDAKTLNCKMLYDTRTDRYPQLRKEDETYFNRARITAVVDIGHFVWVGTGEGNLIIYEVMEQANIKTPTDQSPSTETMSSILSNSVAPFSHKKKFSHAGGDPRIDGACRAKDKKSVEEAVRTDKSLAVGGHVTNSAPSSNWISTTTTSDTASTGTSTPRMLSPRAKPRRVDISKKNEDCNKGKASTEIAKPPIAMERSSSDENVRKNSSKTTCKHRSRRDSLRGHHQASPTQEVKGHTNDTKVESPDNVKPLDTMVGSSETLESVKRFDATENACRKQENVESVHKKSQQTASEDSNRQRKVGVAQLQAPMLKNDTDISGPAFKHTGQCDLKEPKCEEVSIPKHSCHGNKAGDVPFADKNGPCSGDLNEKKNQSEEVGNRENVLPDTLSLNDIGQSLNFNRAMSRHHKVNKWLCSLEGLAHSDQSDKVTDHDDKQGINGEDKLVLNSPASEENILLMKKSVSTEEVCYIADEDVFGSSDQAVLPDEDHSDVCGVTDPSPGFESAKQMFHCDSLESEGVSSVSDKMIDSHLNSNNPEVKYRLDFSGLHIETDSELEASKHTSRCGSVSEISYFNSRKNSLDGRQISLSEFGSRLQSMDSRHNSLDGVLFPGMDTNKVTQADLIRMDNWSLSVSGSPSSSEPRLLDQMQTHTLVSRKLSLCGKRREILDWGDLYASGKQSAGSPMSSVDQKVQDFLRTPSMSSRPSSLWSSYENISTPSQGDEDTDSVGKRPVPVRSIISHSASSVSLCSTTPDVFFTTELCLQMKVKIADKPVRSFLKTSCNGSQVLLSFSGCYGDDEAVLKWRQDPNERLWTNEPIVEICPKTKLTRLPSYMRGRLSSTSSHNSQSSGFSFHSASSRPHT